MSRRPDDWDPWIADAETVGPALPDTLLEIESWLRRLPRTACKRVADLGRGLGTRLQFHAARCEELLSLADTRDLEAMRGRLSVVVAIDTIRGTHLSDIDSTLKAVRNSLVEGGMLLATFPAAPKQTIARAMLVDRGDETPAPSSFHEVELQYRLQRAGLRGTLMRRRGNERGTESLVCRAVRRADN